MLLYGYLAVMQDHSMDQATMYQLETRGSPSSDVYQFGSYYPFHILSNVACKRKCATFDL